MKVKKTYIVEFESETENNFVGELFEGILGGIIAGFNIKYKRTKASWKEHKV
jgi:hypothetical protein